ncbi:MAG: hypothetical protein DYH12_10885 [Sorangiineae bacterium PRO1]|nr:hypothetical protein [Sorangiineae bacterium PRO1]
MLASLALGACMVPATRYEEARSAILVEQEAHRRTQSRLSDVSRKLDELHASLAEREKKLERLEADLAEEKLAAEVAGTERRFATEIVEQLRGELGRTGDHLRELAGEKSKLALALDAAEERARQLGQCEAEAADNAAIARDLALALGPQIKSGEVELAVVEGKPLIRIASSELSGEVVQEIGQKVVGALANVTQRHRASRVKIRETGADVAAEESAKRLRGVSDALVKAGLGSARVELSPAAEPGKGAAMLELSVFSADDAPSD